jgi:predicted PurR-regulated permease PerM
METQEKDFNQQNDSYLDKPFTFDRVIRLLLVISFVLGVIFVLRTLSNVLIPFFVALLLAYLSEPIVVFFQKSLRIKRRGIAVLLTMLLIISIFTALIWWLLPRFLAEAGKLASLIKTFLETHSYKEFIPESIEQWLTYFIDNKQTQDFINTQDVKQLTVILFNSLGTVFTGSINILVGIVAVLIIFLYLFFILLDYQKIEEDWQNLIPVKFRPYAVNISEDLKNSMRIYFRAQVSIALIVGVLLAIGFSIIELPMAISLGIFIGLLNIVPYLQIIGFVPAIFLALLKAMETNSSFGPIILLVFVVMAVVQVIQELILVPRIMGKAYNMNPAIILLSLSVWGSIMGILGMLLALPLTTLIISYYKLFVLKQVKTSESAFTKPNEDNNILD